MASKAELVEQIKTLQRGDPSAKQAWWEFCDSNLGGVKDPNKHDEGVLSDFLHSHANGGPPPARRQRFSAPPQRFESPRAAPSYKGKDFNKGGKGYDRAPSYGGKGYDRTPSYGAPSYGAPQHTIGAPSMVPLGDFVKTGQRVSHNWKNAWQIYCKIYGRGLNDPAKHDEEYMRGFIDYAGQLAADGLSALAEQEGISLDAGPGPGPGPRRRAQEFGGGPPQKRMSLGAAPSSSPEKQVLVDRIKAMQRTDPGAKEAWWQFCDNELGGVKDPSRHEIEALESFLASYE
eukprot:TRINITY_DN2728_c0_g1_i1.p1 TRINITY_DN2728_c0_g1~~TRINITY_DN2728_c0_g1_i1.p1  ORF type:complete len:313 (-),score=65.62 TRINITY_DN2728_c0_g1_i1:217-1080(-)